jgi:hypothetical protein
VRAPFKLTTELGLAVLTCSLVLLGVGVAVYGKEMGPHVIATVAGILGEAALVVLVLDRIARAQEKRDWRFVRQTIGQRMAACVVDVVRLCGVKWSPRAYAANIDRYREFVGIADLHLADLRSNVEGLALGAEPRDYDTARWVELRLAWLVQQARQLPGQPTPPTYDLTVLSETATAISAFLERDPGFASNMASASEGVAKMRLEAPLDVDRFWSARMTAQSQLLTSPMQEHMTARGIWFDISGELAVRYFALDAALLKSL